MSACMSSGDQQHKTAILLIVVSADVARVLASTAPGSSPSDCDRDATPVQTCHATCADRLVHTGHVVYHGPIESTLQFFATMGFQCPERKGVADFLQEVTSKKDQQVGIT